MILDETQRQAAHMRSAAEAESADLRRVAEAQAGMAAGGMIQHLREAADAQAAGIVAEAQAKADDVRRMLTQAQMDFDTQIAEKRRLAEAEITAMKDAAAASPAADASGTTPPATATPAEAKPAAAAAKPAAPVKGSAMKALADAETPGLSDADRAAFQKRKSEMNDAAKREARMIMFCLITSFVGLLYTFGVLAMVQNKASGLVVISVLAIAADLGFLGYMGALIMKHYQQSKQAMANHQGRMAAARAVMSANPPSGPRAVIPKPAGKSTQGAKGGGKKPA